MVKMSHHSWIDGCMIICNHANKAIFNSIFHLIKMYLSIISASFRGLFNSKFFHVDELMKYMDIFTNPTIRVGCDTRSIFKWSLTGLTEHSF